MPDGDDVARASLHRGSHPASHPVAESGAENLIVTSVDRDAGLETRLRRMLGPRHPVAAAATVADGSITVAAIGAPLEAGFEIGSLSKGITGLLYVDARERGDVRPETTLGELLPLGGSAASDVTLQALSTHSSGLPRLPRLAQPLRRALRLWRDGTNPYGENLDELLRQARTVQRATPPKPKYSNLGFELLGHAVARATRMSYQELLRERLTAPLGLESVYAPYEPDELRSSAVPGRNRRGRVVEPWTGEALAPAGGIRASIGDMGLLAHALIEGSAPGSAALDPVAEYGRNVHIGAGWITMALRGRHIAWHDGGTGGFRSWMGIDRHAGTAVVVLSARAVSVDRHGFTLMQQLND